MPIIHFTQPDGTTVQVEASAGISLMAAATSKGVVGIDAECGGAMSCATCHVHIHPQWQPSIGPAGGDEREMLSFLDAYDSSASRLSCQIVVTEMHQGLSVTVP